MVCVRCFPTVGKTKQITGVAHVGGAQSCKSSELDDGVNGDSA